MPESIIPKQPPIPLADDAVSAAQLQAEEHVAAYLHDQADGFEGHEEDAAEAARDILQILLATLSASDFAALQAAMPPKEE